MTEVIQISLDSRNHASSAAKLELLSQNKDVETRKDVWLKLADSLVFDGVPQTEVAITAARLIEENMKTQQKKELKAQTRFVNSWFYQIMKEHGYTSSGDSSSVPDQESKNSSIEEEVIPKNAKLIESLTVLKYFINFTISKARYMDYNIEDYADKNAYKSFLRDVETAGIILKDAVDEKTKFPKNTHYVLKNVLHTAKSVLELAKSYHTARGALIDEANKWAEYSTKKQLTKFKSGEEPNQLYFFAPHSRDDAIFMRYTGYECQNCNKWRVLKSDNSKNGLECLDCGETFEGKTNHLCRHCGCPLYERDMKKIRTTNKCPDCEAELRVP